MHTEIPCDDFEARLSTLDGVHVWSSLTDISGTYGEPRIETVWSRLATQDEIAAAHADEDGTAREVISGRCAYIRTVRRPNPEDGRDTEPCRHYVIS